MKRPSNDKKLSEAIDQMLNHSHLSARVQQATLEADWELLFGKTIKKYTDTIYLNNGILKINVSIAVLKTELNFNKTKMIDIINKHYNANIVNEIIVY